MKERLIQLLDLEQLSPSKFADLIGVQRSSISHVLSGRNKPSFDFLQKTLKAFPGLNAAWLMLGEGSMYEQMGRQVSGNLFDAQEAPEGPETAPEATVKKDQEETGESNGSVASGERQAEKEEPRAESPMHEPSSGSPKRIVQVLVVFDDDTFRAYSPAR